MAWTNPRTWVTGEVVTSSLLNVHLRDNLKAVVTMAGTVAGLGTDLADARTGVIRVGTTPFAHKALVYDPTLLKWVSDTKLSAWANGAALSHNTTVSTAQSGIQSLDGSLDHADFVVAGLSAQVRFTWRWRNQSGSTGNVWWDILGAVEGTDWQHRVTLLNTSMVTLSGSPTFTSHTDLNPNEWRAIGAGLNADRILAFQANLQSSASPNFTTTDVWDGTCALRYTS
jgi:hypothetical protein